LILRCRQINHFLFHPRKCIARDLGPFGFGTDLDAYFLLALARVGEDVVADYHVVRFPEELYAESLGLKAIVADGATLDEIAVGAAEFAQRLAEEQTDLVVAFDGAMCDAVVGVAVADGDAIVEVVAQVAILCQAVSDTPAEENALAVAARDAVGEDRALGAAAGVETEIGIVFRAARFETDIVADLERITVAVVVSRDDMAIGVAIAVLEKDAASVVAVYFIACSPIAVEDQIFDRDVVDPFGREDRKERCGGGPVFEPRIFLHLAAQIERLAVDAGDGILDDFKARIARRAQHNAAAGSETGGICNVDLGFVPVGIAV